MGIGPLAGIAGQFLESFVGSAAGPATAATPPNATSSFPVASQTSPFAQLLNNIQHLAQSKYGVITQNISGTLETAGQKAADSGNTGLADELTKLSGEIGSASINWQLPNITSLAQSIGS